MAQIISVGLCFAIGIFCGIYACMASKERGPLFSNTYLWATPEEREKMDKKPEYKLVSRVFGGLSIVFIMNGIALLTQVYEFAIAAVALMGVIIIYSIIDTVRTSKKS